MLGLGCGLGSGSGLGVWLRLRLGLGLLLGLGLQDLPIRVWDNLAGKVLTPGLAPLAAFSSYTFSGTV